LRSKGDGVRLEHETSQTEHTSLNQLSTSTSEIEGRVTEQKKRRNRKQSPLYRVGLHLYEETSGHLTSLKAPGSRGKGIRQKRKGESLRTLGNPMTGWVFLFRVNCRGLLLRCSRVRLGSNGITIKRKCEGFQRGVPTLFKGGGKISATSGRPR